MRVCIDVCYVLMMMSNPMQIRCGVGGGKEKEFVEGCTIGIEK